jgi:hypothetical protein
VDRNTGEIAAILLAINTGTGVISLTACLVDFVTFGFGLAAFLGAFGFVVVVVGSVDFGSLVVEVLARLDARLACGSATSSSPAVRFERRVDGIVNSIYSKYYRILKCGCRVIRKNRQESVKWDK